MEDSDDPLKDFFAEEDNDPDYKPDMKNKQMI